MIPEKNNIYPPLRIECDELMSSSTSNIVNECIQRHFTFDKSQIFAILLGSFLVFSRWSYEPFILYGSVQTSLVTTFHAVSYQMAKCHCFCLIHSSPLRCGVCVCVSVFCWCAVFLSFFLFLLFITVNLSSLLIWLESFTITAVIFLNRAFEMLKSMWTDEYSESTRTPSHSHSSPLLYLANVPTKSKHLWVHCTCTWLNFGLFSLMQMIYTAKRTICVWEWHWSIVFIPNKTVLKIAPNSPEK